MSYCGSTIGIDCKREYIAALRVASINRSQLVLRTVDVERLIEEDHCSRFIWRLIGRVDLGLYHGEISAVAGFGGRDHTPPQLVISLWLYAYSRGLAQLASLHAGANFSRVSVALRPQADQSWDSATCPARI
jgi:hypothetical protein